MEKTAKLVGKKWSRQRTLWFAQAALGAALIYALALKAIDTGKLQFYFLVFVLFVFVLNRTGKTMRRRRA